MVIKEYAKYLIPDAQSPEEALEELFNKIKEDKFSELISSIELSNSFKR